MIKQKNICRYPGRVICLSLSFLIIVITASCFTGKRLSGTGPVVTPVSDTVRLRKVSIVYALPRTVFTVKMEVERTIEIPGPYAAYADDLLGIKDIIRNKKEQWSVKSISINSHEEADPAEFYVIESHNLFQANVLALKKEGLILDLNAGIYDQNETLNTNKGLNINQFQSFDFGSDEYYEVQSDTAFRRVKVDSSFIRIPYIVEKKKKLTDDQLAERAAKRLMELRDGKIMILAGEANVYPQSDASINEINKMINDYTGLFTGKSFSETRSFSYEFIPEKELAGKPQTLCMFSVATGPAEAVSGIGTPVIIEVIPEQKTKDITIISQSLAEAKAGEVRTDILFYRIPDVASLKISIDGKALYTSRKLVYQLGEVMQLPGNFVIGK